MKPLILIDKPAQLKQLAKELGQAEHIAVDTESNSFYAYFEKICLIQISTEDDDYIIDSVMLKNLEPLSEIFASHDIEKIFHASSNDVLGLKRDYDLHINNLFDTALACKMLGCRQLGLASILQEHFGVQLNKKWQRCDWGRRPLQQEQLDYARLDTHYLIGLRHRLASNLQALDLWENARQSFEKLSEQQIQDRPFHPDGFIYIKGARTLDATGQSILKALYVYREKEAQRRDRAPFRVLSNETLLRLARSRPHSIREILKTKGLPRNYRKTQKAQSLLKLINGNEECSRELEAQL
jgi:ribonuclease D